MVYPLRNFPTPSLEFDTKMKNTLLSNYSVPPHYFHISFRSHLKCIYYVHRNHPVQFVTSILIEAIEVCLVQKTYRGGRMIRPSSTYMQRHRKKITNFEKEKYVFALVHIDLALRHILHYLICIPSW